MNKEFIDDYEDDFYPAKKEPEIQIPEFIKGENVIPTEEQEKMSAIINNVPGKTSNEEAQHLKGMEEQSKNYNEEEWKRILYYAPSGLMTSEIQRRLEADEQYRKAMLEADEIMKQLKR